MQAVVMETEASDAEVHGVSLCVFLRLIMATMLTCSGRGGRGRGRGFQGGAMGQRRVAA